MLGTAVAAPQLCRAGGNCLLRAYARSYLLSSLRDYLNPDFSAPLSKRSYYFVPGGVGIFKIFVANDS